MLTQPFFATALINVPWRLIGCNLAFTTGSGPYAPFIGGLPGTIPGAVSAIFTIFNPALILGGPANRLKLSAARAFLGIWLLAAGCPIARGAGRLPWQCRFRSHRRRLPAAG